MELGVAVSGVLDGAAASIGASLAAAASRSSDRMMEGLDGMREVDVIRCTPVLMTELPECPECAASVLERP
jgi:hypothetical protein